jgi:hypothetical protein
MTPGHNQLSRAPGDPLCARLAGKYFGDGVSIKHATVTVIEGVTYWAWEATSGKRAGVKAVFRHTPAGWVFSHEV